MAIIKAFIDFFQKSCPSCDGSGVTYCNCNNQYEIACPQCMGKGVVEKVVTATNIVEVPCDHPGCQGGKVRCGYCGGSGHLANGEVCPECGGDGMTLCPVCGGTNRIERPYQEQWVKHEICPTCGGKAYIPCPHCHGTKNRVCPLCHGSGKVWDKLKLSLAAAAVVLTALMPMLAITALGFALAGCALYWLYQQMPAEEVKTDAAKERAQATFSKEKTVSQEQTDLSEQK